MEKGKISIEPKKGAWGGSASKENNSVPVKNRGWEQTNAKQDQSKSDKAKQDRGKKSSASAIDYFDFSSN